MNKVMGTQRIPHRNRPSFSSSRNLRVSSRRNYRAIVPARTRVALLRDAIPSRKR